MSVSPFDTLICTVMLFMFAVFYFNQVPMQAISEAKRNYGSKDLHDWAKYHQVEFHFTSHFPLRSVLPLRVTLVNPDDRLRQTICKRCK